MRVFTGIQPSGELTIGNYIAVLRHLSGYQEEHDSIYFVVNLHAISVRQDPELLQKRTLDVLAWFLAAGVDPDKTILAIQSMIPAHAELAWILNNYTTMGELSRMTQFKDKSHKGNTEGELVGLFDYPVLMAADILLYDTEVVPVGDDQKQHVELTRDIAERFNNLYGDTFVIPRVVTPDFGTRIMSLSDPTKKMSKSDPNSYIKLLDDETTIRSKVARAVTDSGDEIRTGADKPALTNLIHIYAAFADQTPQQIEKEFVSKNYGEFKNALADLIVVKLTTMQERFNRIRHAEIQLNTIIQAGNAKASAIADRKLVQVKAKIGLL